MSEGVTTGDYVNPYVGFERQRAAIKFAEKYTFEKAAIEGRQLVDLFYGQNPGLKSPSSQQPTKMSAQAIGALTNLLGDPSGAASKKQVANKMKIVSLLNILEMMAIATEKGIFDKKIIRELFEDWDGMLRRLQPFINYFQTQDKTLYTKFEKFAKDQSRK